MRRTAGQCVCWAGLGWAGLADVYPHFKCQEGGEAAWAGEAAAHPPDRQVQVRREGWVRGIVVTTL